MPLTRGAKGRCATVRGGVWAPRPTTRPRAFCKPCRGRRSRRPVSAGCRQAPAPTRFREGRLWCCRAACPQAAVNIRKCSNRRGGAHGPRPTTLREGLGRICRGDPMWSPVMARGAFNSSPLRRSRLPEGPCLPLTREVSFAAGKRRRERTTTPQSFCFAKIQLP